MEPKMKNTNQAQQQIMRDEKITDADDAASSTVPFVDKRESNTAVLQTTSTRTTTTRMIPISQQATVLAHRIHKDCKTASMAIQIVDDYLVAGNFNVTDVSSLEWEDAWMAVLQVCGKTRDYATAVQIVEQRIPRSDCCRALAITICGRCHQLDEALSLLGVVVNATQTTPIPITTAAPYNAAIAACGIIRAWKEALRIVHDNMPRSFVTTLTCNAVLTALAKSQRGSEAVEFLQQGFDSLGVTRDRTSYHHTVAAMLAQGDLLEQAIRLVLVDMRQESHANPEVSPTLETYDRLIAAIAGRRNNPKHNHHNDANTTDASPRATTTSQQKYQTYYDNLLHQLQQAALEVSVDDTQKRNKKNKKRKHSETVSSQDVQLPLEKRARTNTSTTTTTTTNTSNNHHDLDTTPPLLLPWVFGKWDLPKQGRGKTASWELGVIHIDNDNNCNGHGDNGDNGDSNNNQNSNNAKNNIVVGLHPNRNPSKNGIQLWFFRNVLDRDGKQRQEKLGYLLMINTPHYNYNYNNSNNNNNNNNHNANPQEYAGTSQFLGLKVTDTDRRRQGLAKTFVALWLQCCLDANLKPTTGKMNKPLLCLILQHSFHFTPIAQSGGVRARLLPSLSSTPGTHSDGNDDNNSNRGIVRLTTESSAVKNLAGALTPRDFSEQNIQLVPPTSVPDSQKGRPIDVGGLLQAPTCQTTIQKCIDAVLKNNWNLSSRIATVSKAAEQLSKNNGALVDNTLIQDQNEVPLTMSRLLLGM